MNARALLVNILVIIIILALGGAAIYYYNQTANYIRTNNAQVAGQPVTIMAPAAGRLASWNGQVGKSYNAGDTIGSIQTGATTETITVPISSTIVQQSAVPRSFVVPGTILARAYNLNDLWINANINETDINDLEVGQTVDVYIDAFPGTTLTGTVHQIGLATASTFSLFPSTNTNANYTKVTQVIPVTITIEGYKGLGIVPGMNATVRIHI
ncbi:HlyD family efflux transporter periplasmic adaptor subunit [Paenibacillus sediminis]|uniref:Multidrug resistance efflux pump n=1 Tax=Paenibacillus sediminis TaxID=664909 RepID=A0ABS4H5E3_9BACL|nr:HlyD family efflux transporter periplasmic adaptor subunit [Paenibacillus sediminis]MBP1937686.1 multidrug resistance efflux pump [Paenibacillus sediminis]